MLMGQGLGQTVTGMWVWDLLRLVDYRVTGPEVDSARIGCAGLSGGGLQTLRGCGYPLFPGQHRWCGERAVPWLEKQLGRPVLPQPGVFRLPMSVGPQPAKLRPKKTLRPAAVAGVEKVL